MANPRADVLGLLGGERLARLPAFSGLPSLTATGLAAAGVAYPDAHTGAARMAAAAASTFAVFGFESAVVPFDLCVEAEALGAEVDFQADVAGFVPPAVIRPLSLPALPPDWPAGASLRAAGRVPLVAEAVAALKHSAGPLVAVGAWVPGPFTLGWQVFGMEAWLQALSQGERFAALMHGLAGLLAEVGALYRRAGADFLTVHEMGGSPQVIGPRRFGRTVQPELKRLIAALPGPVVLSVCGDTNAIVHELADCGAAALNVDHRNDLARTRQVLGPDVRLFGNFDPVGLLSRGTPEQVGQTVQAIAAAGADAIWPGCDLWPDIPDENFRALMQAAAAARRSGASAAPPS